MNILIIEDNKDMKEFLEEYCTGNGHQVISVENGKEALEAIKNNPNLDMIISDNEMPIMTGSELFLLMNEKKIKFPPFILWSGNIDSIPNEVIELGPFGLLNKGNDLFIIDELIAKIGISKYSNMLKSNNKT